MPLGCGVPLSRYYGTKEADQIRLHFHILLFRIIYGSRLSYDVDLYLPRIFQLGFYLLGYVPGQEHNIVVTHFIRLGDDPYFPSGLDSI